MNENQLIARFAALINSKIEMQEAHIESIRDQMNVSEDITELNKFYLLSVELITALSDLKEIDQAFNSLLDQLDTLHEYEILSQELTTREEKYFNKEERS